MNNVKNSIGWCDYTVNPVKGLCPMACEYCYARRIYKRFKLDETIKFDITKMFKVPYKGKCFVGSTIELFGDWIKPEWMKDILFYCSRRPEVTWIFLTKQPQNLIKWSPFPENVWIGASATDMYSGFLALEYLRLVQVPVKFLSCEPLMGSVSLTASDFKCAGISWLIIGQLTPASAKTQPRIEWVKEIVDAADKERIPVFLKGNIYSIFKHPEYRDGYKVPEWAHADHGINIIRQEFPKVNYNSQIRVLENRPDPFNLEW